MESQTMNELLEKYWRGETTREEEAQLRQHFRDHEPPGHLRHVAALFQHYEARPRLDDDFDRRLEARLDEGKTAMMWPTLLKVAAVVAIFLGGALWLKRTYLEETPAAPVAVVTSDTYEDPERAYQEAKQALLLVSSLMNEGTEHLTKLEEFDEAQQAVKEQSKAKL